MSNKKSVRTYQRGKTWTYSFETARVAGKRRPVTKGGFPTEKDAYNAGITALANYVNGLRSTEPVKISYGDFIEKWLKEFYIHDVKQASYDQTTRLFRKHVIPELGHIKLVDISRSQVKLLLNKKAEEGYSKGYITQLRAIISKSLNVAVAEYEYIPSNPCIGLPLPKEARQRAPKPRIALTKEEQADLLEHFKYNINYYTAILIGLHCGLRIGEVMGLTWEDVDIDNKMLNVNKQLSHLKKVRIIDAPKYNSSRIISFDDQLAKVLKQLKKVRLEEKLRCSDYPDTIILEDHRNDKQLTDFDLIFRKANGIPFHRVSLDVALSKYGKETGKNIFFHLLRHTHCTDLIIAGAPPKAVQKRMGHKKIDLTLNLYTSLSTELDDQVKTIIDGNLYAGN